MTEGTCPSGQAAGPSRKTGPAPHMTEGTCPSGQAAGPARKTGPAPHMTGGTCPSGQASTAPRGPDRFAGVLRLAFGTALVIACGPPRPADTRPPDPAPTVVAAPGPDPCADAPIPADTVAALARVDVLRRCGAGLSALAIHAELLRTDPRPRWAYELAALALAEGAPERARALLQASGAVQARVGLALIHVAAFEADASDADRDAARTDFQAALAVAPKDPYALCVALRLYLALAARAPERLALAAQLCSERLPASAEGDGGDPRGAALLAATCGRVALESKEPGEARRRYALALRINPPDAGARLAWGAAELAAGNDAAAAELFAGAVRAPGASDRYLAGLGLGVARLRLHDPAGAEAGYRIAAAAHGWKTGDPIDRLPPELLFNLGTLLAQLTDRARGAEARAMLTAYTGHPAADDLRRLRCRQLLHELRE